MNKKEKILEYLQNNHPYAVFLAGLEDAIVGVDMNGCVVYSYEKCRDLFIAGGMTYQEAIEWVDYNVVRTIPYLGEKKPIMLYEFNEGV